MARSETHPSLRVCPNRGERGSPCNVRGKRGCPSQERYRWGRFWTGGATFFFPRACDPVKTGGPRVRAPDLGGSTARVAEPSSSRMWCWPEMVKRQGVTWLEDSLAGTPCSGGGRRGTGAGAECDLRPRPVKTCPDLSRPRRHACGRGARARCRSAAGALGVCGAPGRAAMQGWRFRGCGGGCREGRDAASARAAVKPAWTALGRVWLTLQAGRALVLVVRAGAAVVVTTLLA